MNRLKKLIEDKVKGMEESLINRTEIILKRIGFPTDDEVENLRARIDRLSKEIEVLKNKKRGEGNSG